MASERVGARTHAAMHSGQRYARRIGSRTGVETRARRGKSPVGDIDPKLAAQSTIGHEKPGGKEGGPSPKAKYDLMTDREQYREGTVKRTPGGE